MTTYVMQFTLDLTELFMLLGEVVTNLHAGNAYFDVIRLVIEIFTVKWSLLRKINETKTN